MNFLTLIFIAVFCKTSLGARYIYVLAYETWDKKTSSYVVGTAGGADTINAQVRIIIDVGPNDVIANNTITIMKANISKIYGVCSQLATTVLTDSMLNKFDPKFKIKVKKTLTYEGLLRAAVILYEDTDTNERYHLQVHKVEGLTSWDASYLVRSAPLHKIIFKYSKPQPNPTHLQLALVDINQAAIKKTDEPILQSTFANQNKIGVKGLNVTLTTGKTRVPLVTGWQLKMYMLAIPELKETSAYVGSIKRQPKEKVIQIAVGGEEMLYGKTDDPAVVTKVKTAFATRDLFGVLIDEWVTPADIVPANTTVFAN